MVDRPLVDPPRPLTEEQRRMLVELGREYMHRIQRYEAQSSITKADCLPGSVGIQQHWDTVLMEIRW